MDRDGNNFIRVNNNSFARFSGDLYKLQNIYLPNSTLWIGASAFEDCRELVNAHLGDKLIWIGDNAFKIDGLSVGSLFFEGLPDSIQSIGANAFYNQEKIKLSKLPAELKTIGRAAFRGGLPDVTVTEFGGRLESIGEYAFCDSGSNIKDNTIIIRNSVQFIGNYAFGYESMFDFYQHGKGIIKHVLIEKEKNYDTILGFFDEDIKITYGWIPETEVIA